MKVFFESLCQNWWGIGLLVLLALLLLLLISAILYRPFFKRFYDILLSGIALVVLSPVFCILALCVRIKLGTPIIFRQYRPGKKGNIFVMHKFRTMTEARDEEGKLLPDAIRMTAFGRFLRSTSLDELPELWDIFRGKMSIVGPRPQLVRDRVFMSDEIDRRHIVRGGLTGLAQISGRNAISWEERLAIDLEYVEKYNFFYDLKIIFGTIGKVLKRSDIVTEGLETSEDYGDYLLRTGKINQEEYQIGQAIAKEQIAAYDNGR
jgi:sugar transferase